MQGEIATSNAINSFILSADFTPNPFICLCLMNSVHFLGRIQSQTQEIKNKWDVGGVNSNCQGCRGKPMPAKVFWC